MEGEALSELFFAACQPAFLCLWRAIICFFDASGHWCRLVYRAENWSVGGKSAAEVLAGAGLHGSGFHAIYI